jgi:nucleotide-binding universal stress UspA family protein
MSPFPGKILLATDGSRNSEATTQTAIGLARSTGSELHVVHVGEFLPTFFAHTETESRQIASEARELLAEQVLRVEADGGTVTEAHLRLGKADKEIVALAEKIGAGLIVVGSRGLGRVKRALMGSVSDSVVRRAHGPVLVVRGEMNARRNLEGAVSSARRQGAKESEAQSSFWKDIFGQHRSDREERVLEYIVHRIGEGSALKDVTQEEYVRRNASPAEVDDILEHPRLVEAAREKMHKDFSSGKLNPTSRATASSRRARSISRT